MLSAHPHCTQAITASGSAQAVGNLLSQMANSAASAKTTTTTGRYQCRSGWSVNEKPFNHMAQTSIFSGHAAGQQVDYVGILPGKELLKSLAISFRRTWKIVIQVTQQQDIQLAHSTPAPPAQLTRDHRRRSTSMRLIAAIALAGFRSFGQAFVQFMIVWQRYSRNGSSR